MIREGQRKRKLDDARVQLDTLDQALVCARAEVKLLKKSRTTAARQVEKAESLINHPVLTALCESVGDEAACDTDRFIPLPLLELILLYCKHYWCPKHEECWLGGICVLCENSKLRDRSEDDDNQEEDEDDVGQEMMSWTLQAVSQIHVSRLEGARNFCLLPTHPEDQLVLDEWLQVSLRLGLKDHKVFCQQHPYAIQQREHDVDDAPHLDYTLEANDTVSIWTGCKGIHFSFAF